jgi:hypothetical protein
MYVAGSCGRSGYLGHLPGRKCSRGHVEAVEDGARDNRAGRRPSRRPNRDAPPETLVRDARS